MVNDRGNIKWSSLMLPEHVTLLQEWFKEERPSPKPMLTNDHLEEMEYLVHQAVVTHALVNVKRYVNGYIYNSTGKIRSIEFSASRIDFINKASGKVEHMPINDIVSLDITTDNGESFYNERKP